MKKIGIRTYEGVEAVVYEAIVVPQMLESSVPLLEINSKSVSYLLEDPFNFHPGVAYTYTATLNTSTTAIKVEIGCEIEDWNNVGGDSGDEGEGDSGSGDEEGDGKTYADLSVVGTANCYLIQGAGDYKFKTVIGNTDATVGNVKSVEVLWESFGTDEMPKIGDLIESVSYKDGYIRFSTPENFRDGNAVIAAKNSNGIILWSWHIWCAEEGWEEQVYYNDAGTMMDRNLGATSATPGDVGALGLMYQWGRKDPFMGSSSISSDVSAVSTGTWSIASGDLNINEPIKYTEAEENPMTFYAELWQPKVGWISTKTVCDPCPVGWRVPEGGVNGVWAKALGTSSSVLLSYDWTNMGINFTGAYGDAESIWYPAAGYRSYYERGDGELISPQLNTGYFGYYWSCTTRLSYSRYYGHNLLFSCDGEVLQSGNITEQANGLSVRCQKDK
jgi:hypothetical protein